MDNIAMCTCFFSVQKVGINVVNLKFII
jgi:hypothetical protein